MKTILVPIDFSANSKKAMDYAALLAQKLDMRIILLHAYHPSKAEKITNSYKLWTEKTLLGTPEEMEFELSAWCHSIRSMKDAPVCSSIFIKCDLLDEISYMVETHAADLVIMGTKGASGLKEVFIGSNTARVMQLVSCPVIAVPETYQYTGIKKIVFATDYHERDIACICFLVRFARKFNAELMVVHMLDGELKPTYEADLLRYFQEEAEKAIGYGKLNFNVLKAEDVGLSLNDLIKMENVDLFALSMNERQIKGSVFGHGLSWKLAHHIQIPMLAFQMSDSYDPLS
jgi:nucleotide-binding universal stress UspA family protein